MDYPDEYLKVRCTESHGRPLGSTGGWIVTSSLTSSRKFSKLIGRVVAWAFLLIMAAASIGRADDFDQNAHDDNDQETIRIPHNAGEFSSIRQLERFWGFTDPMASDTHVGQQIAQLRTRKPPVFPPKTATVIDMGWAILREQLPSIQQRMVDEANKNADYQRAKDILKPFRQSQNERFLNLTKPIADAGDGYVALMVAGYTYPWMNDNANADDCLRYATQAEKFLVTKGEKSAAATAEMLLGDLYIGAANAPITKPSQSVVEATKWYEAALANGAAVAVLRLVPLYVAGGGELRLSSKHVLAVFPSRKHATIEPNFVRAYSLGRFAGMFPGANETGEAIVRSVTPTLSIQEQTLAENSAEELFKRYKQTYPENFSTGAKAATATGSSPAKLLTKVEWKQKLAAQTAWRPGLDLAIDRKAFVDLMGQPTNTQTMAGTEMWYYECAGGTIQLELRSDALNLRGMMVGTINDF